MRQKKGQLGMENIFFVMAFLFASALFLVILFYAWGQINTPLETAINSALPDGETTFNVSTTNTAVNTGTLTFNVLYPFLILGLILMVIIAAYFTESNTVFFFITLVVVLVAIILSVVFSNVFQQITTTSAMSGAASEFNITSLFLEKFPLIITVIIMITLVVLYTRVGRGSGGL